MYLSLLMLFSYLYIDLFKEEFNQEDIEKIIPVVIVLGIIFLLVGFVGSLGA